MNMNKKEIKKLESLLLKSANQKEAVLTLLKSNTEGFTLTKRGAAQAGIADLTRVINLLRHDGVKISAVRKTSRNFGEYTTYGLTPVKRSLNYA